MLGTFTVGASPQGVAVDARGNAWVANRGDNTVTELSSTGSVLGTFTEGIGPNDVAVDASGHVWVSNSGNNTVAELLD